MRENAFVNFKTVSKSEKKYESEVVLSKNQNEIHNIIPTFYKITCVLLSKSAISYSSKILLASLKELKYICNQQWVKKG